MDFHFNVELMDNLTVARDDLIFEVILSLTTRISGRTGSVGRVTDRIINSSLYKMIRWL